MEIIGEFGYRLVGGPIAGTVYSDRTELDNGIIIEFNKVDWNEINEAIRVRMMEIDELFGDD